MSDNRLEDAVADIKRQLDRIEKNLERVCTTRNVLDIEINHAQLIEVSDDGWESYACVVDKYNSLGHRDPGAYEFDTDRVDWYYGHGTPAHAHITSALGNNKQAGDEFIYPGMNEYGVVILEGWIGGGSGFHVVNGPFQLADEPRILHDKTQYGMIAHVNDKKGDYKDNNGGYIVRIRKPV